ncbi:unnamed protein product [Candidula unifasciata]|uniref:WD repeat-containing protein 91 n=1 Tax=Candidula unifasciata TaxID=100452 RepID=A0A8S3Z735_9EUPU|nr:unnamed protein product [Candidula unifasciata]
MATSCEKLDQLVKDYLLFRGFSSTLKAFDQELKTDKDRGLRVDRMMENIWSLIVGYDLQGLKEYWRYLNQRLFSRLEQRYAASERKLETSLLKLYIVNAQQSGRQDKVLAFFEQMGVELQTHPDFKEWFAFPFVSSPAENSLFSLYFNKQWQDTLLLSLHNFLSVVLQAMHILVLGGGVDISFIVSLTGVPVPTLLNVEFDARRMKTLQEENTSLKQQLLNEGGHMRDLRSATRRNMQLEGHPPPSPPDMVFDFSGLANESETPDPERQKTTRRFPLSLTSPLMGRKKSDSTLSKGKVAVQQQSSSASTSAAVGASAQGRQWRLPDSAVNPLLQNSGQGDGRRSSIATSALSSTSSQSSTTRQPVVSKQTATVRQSPVQLVKHSSYSSIDPVSMTAASQLANRSLSVPETKNTAAGRGRSLTTEVTSDVLQSSQSSLSHSPASSGVAMGSSADSDSAFALANDADSPFLLLEDEYREHSSAASYCHFSLNGQYVASLDVDGVVKVWHWSPQPATTATVMSKSAFLSLAWASKSDRWLLLGNRAGTIRLFDVKESKTYREVLVKPDNPANCMRVNDLSTSPSNMQFVCATSDFCPFTSDINTVSGRLLQWDLRTLKLERALLVDSTVCTAITCSSYSQSGHLLLTGGADGSLRIYDSSLQKPVQKWPGHDLPIHTVQFMGDKSVYSMSADGKLQEWSLHKPGQLVNTLSFSARDLGNVGKASTGSCRGRLFCLDLDHHYLLTYMGRRGVIYKVTGVASPTCVMELRPHQSPVVTVDWSPSVDTRVCLTSSADGKVKISTLLSK